jgi:hypothetical protein
MRALPLTVVKGGINRQRTKGGAKPDLLYDLVNGFVTDVGTIRSRPGTERIATLNELTRGIVAFEGSLHTFSHRVVPTPAGVTLHVLQHPEVRDAGSQEVPITGGFVVDITTAQTAGSPFLTGAGTESTGLPIGGTIATTGRADDIEANAVYVGNNTSGYTPQEFIFCELRRPVASGAVPEDAFETFEFTDASSVLRTFDRADADSGASGSASSDGTYNYRQWFWLYPLANVLANASNYVLTFDGGAGPPPPQYFEPELIPLEKIHFAAPFMGALYVVAEFEGGDIFHYWLQPAGPWEPDKIYSFGAFVTPTVPNGLVYQARRASAPNPQWAPNVPRFDGIGDYEEQSVVEPTVYNDYYYVCVQAVGTNPTSGETEPTWPTTPGAQVTEEVDDGSQTPPPTSTPDPSFVISPDLEDRYNRSGLVQQ